MNFRKGLSKFAFFLAGEEGLVLANNAAVPNWFFEGDAVLQETIVTGQGRGRLPSFFSEYRALWDADRDYSYMKLRNGSMKDLVPDHYIMGYMLVTYGRDKYGDEFWKKVTDNATRYKPFFYPFQGAVKKHAGVPFKEFVKATYDQFRTDPAYNKGDSATPISKTTGM
jgi:hypothetical protein